MPGRVSNPRVRLWMSVIGGAVESGVGFGELVEGRVALMGGLVVWLAGPFTNGPYRVFGCKLGALNLEVLSI